MSGLSRFSKDEIFRIKCLHFNEKKNAKYICENINSNRSDRLCTASGVRKCLKRLTVLVHKKKISRRKLGMTALALIDSEVIYF